MVVLKCPRCGWIRRFDVGLGKPNGWHCLNCDSLVTSEDLDTVDVRPPPA